MTMNQQAALERQRALYREKNAHLGKYLEPVEPFEFYREIFPEGSFERRGHFEDAKGNGIALVVPPKNGVALEIQGDGKAHRHVITDELKELEDIKDTEFTIMSPISYFGRKRNGKNARYLYAMVFDLKILKELKYALTRQIWNRFTSSIREPQMQGILQGFRVVGTGTKLGKEYPVVAYRYGGAVELEKLFDYIPDSNGEQQRIQALMRKSRLSLAEAKEKYPDWYERRVVKKERRGRWTVKRDLYDWWLHRIADEIRVGHRFYGIMTLAIYAKKCGIDEEELRHDAFALIKPYDDMSVEDINRFTKDDVVCALEMFNEDYVTFPRDDIAKISGLTMPVNKRNWRKQKDHLEIARAIRDIGVRQKGKKDWRDGNGRHNAEWEVYRWRQQHPEGRKADCIRDTGLSKPTVYKWWDSEPPAVWQEDGHMVARVRPSQALSDLLVEALKKDGD